MKIFTGIVLISGLLLAGCSAQRSSEKTLYLKTEMQSSVSNVAENSEQVDSLLKEDRVRHIRMYGLQPLAGKIYHDDFDKKYTAVFMYIDMIKDRNGYTAVISGSIDYYDTQRYVNGKLVGDVIKSVPIPTKNIVFEDRKAVSIELPRGIRFTAQLSENCCSGITY
ncbi:hypothetical protein [Dickeya oryzae]|uniref:hypothetical protein n=1 Tax=Dickeya oryzae TaxID=1240404 RepID=UPI0012982338|nr:hypothetical protein [Dickeya oryzae]UUE10747.1 hypothetical protein NMX13_03925 [Dickeya zeae]